MAIFITLLLLASTGIYGMAMIFTDDKSTIQVAKIEVVMVVMWIAEIVLYFTVLKNAEIVHRLGDILNIH